MTRILRLPEVEARVGLKRSAIYREIQLGSFPAPVRLTARAVGWSEAAIDEWIEVRLAGRAWSAATNPGNAA